MPPEAPKKVCSTCKHQATCTLIAQIPALREAAGIPERFVIPLPPPCGTDLWEFRGPAQKPGRRMFANLNPNAEPTPEPKRGTLKDFRP